VKISSISGLTYPVKDLGRTVTPSSEPRKDRSER
jgi:hypothetical protein